MLDVAVVSSEFAREFVQFSTIDPVEVAPIYTPASTKLVPSNIVELSENATTGVCVSGRNPSNPEARTVAVDG